MIGRGPRHDPDLHSRHRAPARRSSAAYIDEVGDGDLHVRPARNRSGSKRTRPAAPARRSPRTPNAPGKWTVSDVLQHIIDTERIFAYRALRFARGDQCKLPGFDENLFARTAASPPGRSTIWSPSCAWSAPRPSPSSPASAARAARPRHVQRHRDRGGVARLRHRRPPPPSPADPERALRRAVIRGPPLRREDRRRRISALQPAPCRQGQQPRQRDQPAAAALLAPPDVAGGAAEARSPPWRCRSCRRRQQ